MRQYQSTGDILDEMRTFGFRNGVESILKDMEVSGRGGNGHNWLTVEEGQGDYR